MPGNEPSDAQIEQCLRGVVSRLLRLDDGQQLTVKNARAAAEEALDLPTGFFKTHARWKDRSKDFITDVATELQDNPPAEGVRPSEHKSTKPNDTKTSKHGTKRGSDDEEADRDTQRSKKKPKIAAKEINSEADENDEDAEEEESPADNSEPDQVRKSGSVGTEHDADNDGDDDDDLSSLSDVRDSPRPTKKKRKKSSSASGPTEHTSKAKTKSKPSAASDPSPQEAEIKRLQSQLVKCGIRKLWHRELAPYSTDKAKIAHLRNMLADAGIEGRFSEDKARQIRERRELAADLEAVQEGNKMWGQSDDEGEEEGGGARPRKRLAKGLRDISAFISDGEETD